MEWTQEDDLLLAETALRHIRENSSQLNAFEEVGEKLNRTSAACGFRWNAVVKHNYINAIEFAKKQRKTRKNHNDMGVGNMGKVEVLKDHKKEIEFWLKAISNPDITNENKKLLNHCLQIELNQYLFPSSILFKTDSPELNQLFENINL
jgi:RsfA family transcription factor